MLNLRRASLVALALTAQQPSAFAQAPASTKPYQVEWMHLAKYTFQDEFWRLFQTYQIAELDEEKRRGYVRSYSVFRPVPARQRGSPLGLSDRHYL
jgi:hypothetical protein